MIKICLSNYNSSIFQCCGNYLPWRRTSVILDVICLILLWICLTLTNTSVKFWSIKFWALWVFKYQFQLQEMSDYWTFTILAFRYQVIRLSVLGQFLFKQCKSLYSAKKKLENLSQLYLSNKITLLNLIRISLVGTSACPVMCWGYSK